MSTSDNARSHKNSYVALEPETFVDVLVKGLNCPECEAPVQIAISSWDSETGDPNEFRVQCLFDDEDEDCGDCDGTGDDGDGGFCESCGGLGDVEPHRYYQSDWQPVIDRAEAWARAQGFRVPMKKDHDHAD